MRDKSGRLLFISLLCLSVLFICVCSTPSVRCKLADVFFLILIDAFVSPCCVSLTACVELFGSLVCFLSATIQRPHHGWILGVETEPPDRWKSVTMMVSFYSSFIKSKRSSTLLCSGSGTAGDARGLRSEAPLVYCCDAVVNFWCCF